MLVAVRKQSVALDENVLAAAQRSASKANTSLSAWLNRAARRELTIERGLAAVAEWESENGPIPPLELRRADAALARVLGRPRVAKTVRRAK